MKLTLAILWLLLCTLAIAQQQSSPEASLLISQVLNSKKENDPTKSQKSYSYNTYENLKIAGNPEIITGPEYKKKELRKTLQKTKVFFSEKTSQHIYDQIKGNKETITAAYMTGFDRPIYAIYHINFQSENIYEADYIIFDQKYRNPLHDTSYAAYVFEIEKDSTISGRTVTKLKFSPKDDDQNQLLTGWLYIDKETYAVAKAIYQKQEPVFINAHHEFVYDTDYSLWFHNSRKLNVKQEPSRTAPAFFEAQPQLGKPQKAIETLKKNERKALYLTIEAVNTNFKVNEEVDYGREGLKIEVLDSAVNKNESYWNAYRNEDTFSNTALAQFMNLDSIIDATKIRRKLEVLNKFKVGYYPLGVFDVDLKYLVKFNDYESLRLGMGGQTNEKLSEKFRIDGYVAYGTKDKVLKHKLGIGLRLHKEKDTWLNIYRQEDINEFAAENFLTDARVYSLFEPRLVNITTFYSFEQYGMSLQQRLLPSLISEISLSRKRISQTTDYQFLTDQGAFTDYTLAEIVIGARWSPASDYMRTPKGYQDIATGYPIISAQLTQGFKGITQSDFNYTKVSAKTTYAIETGTKSSTEFTVEGHYSAGTVPLTHLFHAYPNAPNKAEIMQRFSVAGTNSFETMYFNEFFSDQLLIGQVKHRLAPFNIFSFLKPEMVLISKAAWGGLKNTQQHQNIAFDTLEKGYFESGFELNKLLFGFGISASYRYGAYHLPNFEDNVALKFTFYLEL